MTGGAVGASTMAARRRWGSEERLELLSTTSPFRGLAPALLAELAELLRPERYDRGERVLAEGLPASRFHLLAEGRVKVMRGNEEGREVILRLIGPGEIFGSDGLWGGEAYELGALAVEDCVVLRMLVGKATALMETRPEFAAALVREFGRRLRDDDARIGEDGRGGGGRHGARDTPHPPGPRRDGRHDGGHREPQPERLGAARDRRGGPRAGLDPPARGAGDRRRGRPVGGGIAIARSHTPPPKSRHDALPALAQGSRPPRLVPYG